MNLLLIEDDILLCQSLEFQLKQENINITTCNNGIDGMLTALNSNFDLIILDRMLPDIDGINILKNLRSQKYHPPVIILTALGSLDDKIIGLDSGADDYIVKPFEFEELMARIRSLLRRPHETIFTQEITFGDITYYHTNQNIVCNTKHVQLSKKEAALFEVLIYHAGTTVSRETIISKVWGSNCEIENGNLDNYIYFIRKRLASIHSKLTIKTAHGIGYCLCY